LPGSGTTADFAKVDIDGGECDVLPGLIGLPTILIETHSKDLEEVCTAFLEEHGYATRVIRNARWRALWPEYRPLEHNRWLVAERT
jgi:hypothetical protein